MSDEIIFYSDTVLFFLFPATGGKQKIRIGINGKIAKIFEILAFCVAPVLKQCVRLVV